MKLATTLEDVQAAASRCLRDARLYLWFLA